MTPTIGYSFLQTLKANEINIYLWLWGADVQINKTVFRMCAPHSYDGTRHASRVDFHAVFTLCRITRNVSFPVFPSSIRSIRLGVFFNVLLRWALKQIVLICNVTIVRLELVNKKPVAGSKIVMCSRVQYTCQLSRLRRESHACWLKI